MILLTIVHKSGSWRNVEEILVQNPECRLLIIWAYLRNVIRKYIISFLAHAQYKQVWWLLDELDVFTNLEVSWVQILLILYQM